MNYNLPPFNEKEKHGFFEQTILDFSTELFKNKVFGFSLGIILNTVFIYSFFNKYKFKNIFLLKYIQKINKRNKNYFSLCLQKL